MKYLSSILFIAGTCIMAYHEALSTVSKHGTVDLISTWEWHISQFGVVILFTASGVCFGYTMIRRKRIWDDLNKIFKEDFNYPFSFSYFGKIAAWGLAPALIIYQFLYPWLCELVR